ncbi:outer membrane protein assembly factor BamB family protein [Fulvivirga lutea]|uniref:PQQ-binding-like beta-propeller repeat protein n=1 Tax=Fulvivirga lutea TaxID=2810512 RepID=A0A974WIN8_9BACT|nr:PQQ-binding-like beta-propeller repeat protein [Fulvivirga lutea]QSE99151.1 PQQ-binding-like beta-propeller repeat protein [Fulvivirga lutea]
MYINAKTFVGILSLALLSTTLFAQLEPSWKFNTYSSIYGGAATDGSSIYFGNEGGEFYALSQAGEERWQVNLSGSIKSTPAVSNKAVYINTGEGILYAINPKKGTIIWEKKLGEEKKYDLWDYYLSSPLIENDRLYVGLGDGNVTCVSASDGRIIWSFKTVDAIHATPVIDGSSLFIGSFDGFLYSLNKSTGELNWKFDTAGSTNYPNGEIQKKALVDVDWVYVTCRGNFLYKINKTTGAKDAEFFEPGSWIIAAPVLVGNNLLFGTSDSQKVRSVDKNTLKENWSATTTMRIYGQGIAAESNAYFTTFDGKVIQVNTSTGDSQVVFQTQTSKENYSLIYNEQGYFRKDMLQLYGSNIAAAEKLLLLLGAFAGEGLKHDGQLIYGNSNGTLYSFTIGNE